MVVDPWANTREALNEYGIVLTKLEDVKNVDCVIVAVAHREFRLLPFDKIKGLFRKCADSKKVLIDVKGLFEMQELVASGYCWWRL